jgi:hypothetical protein
MTELANVADRLGGQQGERLEAVVAVEQARAVAQVAAQVQVAQQFPRDLTRIRAELDEACDSHDLAAVAFYALPNRGQGLSVHLARELAVMWGNVDYGVHELRRDDERGASEVQAFCWDMQRNSRATRTFQVPHAITVTDRRTKVQTRQPIVDLQDVYRNNQNAGARAMRECVFATLPRWLVDGAERRLRETLRRGPGKLLPDRIAEALVWARRVRLTQQQLERRVGKPVADWTNEDVAALEVVATSIGRGETTTAEQFDQAPDRVTVDELIPPPPVPPAPRVEGDGRPATQPQIGRLIGKLRDLGYEDDDAQRAWFAAELRRDLGSRTEITRAEFDRLDPILDALIAERGDLPDGDEQ